MAPEGSAKNGNNKRSSCAKHWAFTLFNFKETDIDVIVGSKFIEFYAFQEEICPTTNNLHLQGFISFKKKCRYRESDSQIQGCEFSSRPNWSITRSIEHLDKYVRKAKTSTGRRWSNYEIPEEPECLSREELYPWQINLLELLEINPPPKRTIYWRYCLTGGSGKSEFARFLIIKYNALMVSGSATDMKHAVVKYLEKQERPNPIFPRILILDIPRSRQASIDYAGIEELKNGTFYSSKYEGEMVVFPRRPHVVVFANREPRSGDMSIDKWDIVDINPIIDTEE